MHRNTLHADERIVTYPGPWGGGGDDSMVLLVWDSPEGHRTAGRLRPCGDTSARRPVPRAVSNAICAGVGLSLVAWVTLGVRWFVTGMGAGFWTLPDYVVVVVAMVALIGVIALDVRYRGWGDDAPVADWDAAYRRAVSKGVAVLVDPAVLRSREGEVGAVFVDALTQARTTLGIGSTASVPGGGDAQESRGLFGFEERALVCARVDVDLRLRVARDVQMDLLHMAAMFPASGAGSRRRVGLTPTRRGRPRLFPAGQVARALGVPWWRVVAHRHEWVPVSTSDGDRRLVWDRSPEGRCVGTRHTPGRVAAARLDRRGVYRRLRRAVVLAADPDAATRLESSGDPEGWLVLSPVVDPASFDGLVELYRRVSGVVAADRWWLHTLGRGRAQAGGHLVRPVDVPASAIESEGRVLFPDDPGAWMVDHVVAYRREVEVLW